MKTVAQIARYALIAVLAAVVAWCAITVRDGYALYREALGRQSIEEAVAELRETPGYTPIEELPQRYLDAVVAIEDHRFYEHGGIDVIAIGRALLADISTLSLREGGSTITQQVAKNLFFTKDKRFERKVAEVFMVHDLEAAYGKREILELYVNSAFFGRDYTGIGQASWGYLGHAPAEMDDYECTLMAGFPNAPNLFATDPKAAAVRQQLVVQQMERYGFDAGEAAPASAQAG
ncbi:biosynthetic peptidoglycan transglycosylase [Collinsella tanakaei]|uniref:biosynthetic peptidoglycan transglycosylase n=1 Tax=Collinsella tanakaei TaxID=626935 RepID=UPI00195AE72C|nr:biosynthetic peptidoglycan transglycosylase [Collinsella tanakaei]MBM6868621.1 transglycosylase domain-containing protein [Collinsella tanakaei]